MMINEKNLKIVFAGTPDFSAEHLQALIDAEYDILAVLTQPDKPAGRGQAIVQSPVKQLALKYNIPVYQPKTLRDKDIQKSLRALSPNLIVVVAYGMILPKEILMISAHGCINVHFSLLPRWRGMAPIIYAILAGDLETGVTIMQMDEHMDTGNILLQSKCVIEGGDTTAILQERLTRLGARALLNTLEQLSKNELSSQPQEEKLATYTHKVTKETAVVNWKKPAAQLYREILAYNPWPISHTRIADETIRIYQASPLSAYTSEKPGKIIQFNADGLDVATGEGVLRIKALQFPGKNVLSILDVLNSKKDFFETHDQFE